jgi:subtilisin
MESHPARPRSRATHLVVFREPSGTNESVLADQLKLGSAKRVASRERRGVVRFAARSSNTRDPRLFSSVGVAAVDLNPDEVSSLKRLDAVKDVVPNQKRFAQVLRGTDEPGRSRIALPQTSPNATGDRPMTLHEVAAYARGHRDMAERILMLVLSHLSDSRRQLGSPGRSWCLDMIGLGASMDQLTGQGTKVAVLDTGIALDHPDVRGRLGLVEGEPNDRGATAVSFVEGESVQDGNGHGSHCAGVVGGPRSPQAGPRYGVAPDVSLLVGKVLSNDGSGWDDDIIDAIVWAADRGARIVSLSLGSERAAGQEFSAAYEQVAARLLQEEPGVLLVAAAGNESDRPHRIAPVGNPAACPSILSVAAVDRHAQIAAFSCGQRDSVGDVNLSAPGVDVRSSVPGGYESFSGTSMATPHVAGIAALALQLNPNLSATQLWRHLEGRARQTQPTSDFGAGIAQVG